MLISSTKHSKCKPRASLNIICFTGPVEVYYESIHSSEGSVDAGNYTYYTLKQPGTIRLVLTPLVGDPDLYISEGKIYSIYGYFSR